MVITQGTSAVRHYKELKVWQKAMDLSDIIYDLTEKFPAAEKYGLVAQMRRAAISVPSNIAEGQSRQGTKEFLQFLSHASGFLAELDTQLILSIRRKFLREKECEAAFGLIGELQRMIAALRRKLESSLATSH